MANFSYNKYNLPEDAAKLFSKGFFALHLNASNCGATVNSNTFAWQRHIMSRLQKRKEYISWDEYFMGVALLSARRSKDPNTQVGACIVNDQKKIVGAGYNGLPTGCDDDEFPWEKQGDFLQTKYPFICHAELNAILNNIGMNLKGCKIYTALFPCNECTKAIIQSGITEVIYLSDKYEGNDIFVASKIMLDKAGVRYRKVHAAIEKLELSFKESDV